MELNEMRDLCTKQADELGWNESVIPVPEMVALLCSEAVEALEAHRNHEPLSWTDDKGKPQGIASEFADILIRVGHYAGRLGIDLDQEVKRKLKYNMTRGHRHGGKAC